MSIENEIYGMRADIGALSATVTHLSAAVSDLAESVRTLEAAGVKVQLDLAKYRGTVAGALLVLTLIGSGLAWVWDQLI